MPRRRKNILHPIWAYVIKVANKIELNFIMCEMEKLLMKGKELLVYVKKVFEMESAIRIQEEVLKKSG